MDRHYVSGESKDFVVSSCVGVGSLMKRPSWGSLEINRKCLRRWNSCFLCCSLKSPVRPINSLFDKQGEVPGNSATHTCLPPLPRKRAACVCVCVAWWWWGGGWEPLCQSHWIGPEYIKATLFKSVPESSWWKTPLQEHNNGLQCFPSAEGERPVTARAAWSGLNNVSIYGHQRHHKTAPEVKTGAAEWNAKAVNKKARFKESGRPSEMLDCMFLQTAGR